MTAPRKDVVLANSIRESNFITFEEFIDQVSADQSLATQPVADAFLTAAVNRNDFVDGRGSALFGLFKVLQMNPAAANSTMITVVDSFAEFPKNAQEVNVQADAILKLVAEQRPDLSSIAMANLG